MKRKKLKNKMASVLRSSITIYWTFIASDVFANASNVARWGTKTQNEMSTIIVGVGAGALAVAGGLIALGSHTGMEMAKNVLKGVGITLGSGAIIAMLVTIFR